MAKDTQLSPLIVSLVSALGKDELRELEMLVASRTKQHQITRLSSYEQAILRALIRMLKNKGYAFSTKYSDKTVRWFPGLKLKRFKSICSYIRKYEIATNIPNRSLTKFYYLYMECVYARAKLNPIWALDSSESHPGLRTLLHYLQMPHSTIGYNFPGYNSAQIFTAVVNFEEE